MKRKKVFKYYNWKSSGKIFCLKQIVIRKIHKACIIVFESLDHTIKFSRACSLYLHREDNCHQLPCLSVETKSLFLCFLKELCQSTSDFFLLFTRIYCVSDSLANLIYLYLFVSVKNMIGKYGMRFKHDL